MSFKSNHVKGIGGKMLLIFLSINLLAIASITIFSIYRSSGELTDKAFNQLLTVESIKKTQIENFFNERIGDARVLANDPYVKQAFIELNNALDENGGSESGNFAGLGNGSFEAPEAFKSIHDKYISFFQYYMDQYGYYDIFLLDPEQGDTSFTVTKEADFGIRVSDVDSSLKDVWQDVLKDKGVHLSDTKPYKPSNNLPSQFVAAPIMDGNKLIGILALQISLDAVNNIMQQRDGMGVSGETYLVGYDKLMRSDSFVDKSGNHSVVASMAGNISDNGVDTVAVSEVFKGRSGSQIITDYSGNSVLSVYEPLLLDDITWAIIAEIDEAEINEPINNMIWRIILMSALILLIVVVITIVFSRSISKPIQITVEIAEQISTGNLALKVEKKYQERSDEVGQLAIALNNMIEKISNIVENVQSSASNLSAGSEELSSSANQLSQGASEQAASTEEVSSSMEEMGSNIQQNTDNANQTENIARKAAIDAKESGEAVENAVEAMNEIAKKITIIEEIARQTNLLALNAAIEAARAGEYGKGFAVVASEIRQLAERSQSAAGEISELSSASVEVAEKAGVMLTALVPDIQTTSELVQEISAASNEQNSGVEQINQALIQLDKITQINATSSEEIAATSEELASQSVQLNEAMSFFRIDGQETKIRRIASLDEEPEERSVELTGVGQST